jgi:hypothetical protein
MTKVYLCSLEHDFPNQIYKYISITVGALATEFSEYSLE